LAVLSDPRIGDGRLGDRAGAQMPQHVAPAAALGTAALLFRQLLYVTALRAALAALKGHMLGWNKLIRTGRVADHFSS
jgi:hypothetical protein